MHGQGNVELRLRLTRDRLVVEVTDQGRHLPRRRWTSRDDERGRGRHVVAALAARWGFRLSGGGKVVWAEVDPAAPDEVPGDHDHDHACAAPAAVPDRQEPNRDLSLR